MLGKDNSFACQPNAGCRVNFMKFVGNTVPPAQQNDPFFSAKGVEYHTRLSGSLQFKLCHGCPCSVSDVVNMNLQ